MKMKLLVVVPRIVNEIGEWYQFPLGIAYISSSLKKACFKVDTLNLNNEFGTVEDILNNRIVEGDIDIVLTGGLTGQYGAVVDVVENTKKTKNDVITIVGGGIITSAPEDAMKALKYVDYGVIGEGEIISCELCAAIENGEDITKVPGVVYSENNTYTRTGDASPVDIEIIPFPDYEGLGFGELLSSVPNIIGMSEYNTLPIITSRSCPYRCTFCFHPSGTKFRQRSLDSIFAEIDFLSEKYNVKYLSIQDELFGYDMKRVKAFCERIKKYNIKWLANFRVTEVTPELIATLEDGNCATMAFGIESADNRVLKSMRKQITIEQTEKALELVYLSKMGIQGVLIFGDIAETVETANNTINWWKEHIHYGIQLSAIITYPGTALYDYARTEGIIKDPVQYIKDACPLVRLSKMTDEENNWLLGQIMSLSRMMHINPGKVRIEKIDYEKASMDIVGLCVACNVENEWKQSRLFIHETLTCENCGQRHVAPIPDSIVNILRKSISCLENKYGEIVFWGINSYFYTLAELLGISSHDNIFFVDQSKVRHGVDVAGKAIRSPEIIADRKIKCVVVAVVQYFSGLQKPIKNAYPHVEKILSLSELLILPKDS